MSKPKKDNALQNIFLERMRVGDVEYLDSLTDEQLKEIQPYVMLMWINGAYGDSTDVATLLIRVANFTSGKIFSLGQHRRLLLRLLISLHDGLNIRGYRFIKPNIGKKVESLEIQAVCSIFNCSPRHAKQMYNLVPKDVLEEVVEYLNDV